MVYVVNEPISASNAFEMKETLYTLIHDADDDLILDLTQLDRIDSTGLGVLVSVYKRLQAKKRRLILRNVHDNLRRVLEITMLDQVLEIR